jgi:hypothetical protein
VSTPGAGVGESPFRDGFRGYAAGMISENDPVLSRCPVCLARVYVGSGDPCPPHKPDESDHESDELCPGTGQPTL